MLSLSFISYIYSCKMSTFPIFSHWTKKKVVTERRREQPVWHPRREATESTNCRRDVQVWNHLRWKKLWKRCNTAKRHAGTTHCPSEGLWWCFPVSSNGSTNDELLLREERQPLMHHMQPVSFHFNDHFFHTVRRTWVFCCRDIPDHSSEHTHVRINNISCV